MNTSKEWSLRNSNERQKHLRCLRDRRRRARLDPNEFIEFCFTDPSLRPIRQAPVHRELQAFLTAKSRALIELPRDHGKSFQVCCRVLWELGHNPGLRVRIICATGG